MERGGIYIHISSKWGMGSWTARYGNYFALNDWCLLWCVWVLFQISPVFTHAGAAAVWTLSQRAGELPMFQVYRWSTVATLAALPPQTYEASQLTGWANTTTTTAAATTTQTCQITLHHRLLPICVCQCSLFQFTGLHIYLCLDLFQIWWKVKCCIGNYL